MRYDAAIIGAGAEGLAAAITLAKSGRKVIVVERNDWPGGRCITREFHPGFHASPFCDEVPAIPADIFWALDIARHGGALFMPKAVSTALWPDRAASFRSGDHHDLTKHGATLVKSALLRAEADVMSPRRSRLWPLASQTPDPWPAGDWATQSLAKLLMPEADDNKALMMASKLEGRLTHPDHAGSALHLLACNGLGQPVGGLQSLTDSLLASVETVGAEISCGLEATDILQRSSKAVGVRLADGTEIAARAIISTLDLKRTFLSLFAWSELPVETSRRVAAYRIRASTARLLFALDSLPERPAFAPADLFPGPIYVAPSADAFGQAYAAWRTETLAKHLPITLRFTSARDPRLSPLGAAVLTATVDGVPARLFDGAWTHERRDVLRDQVLDEIDRVLPGTKLLVRAGETIVPPDIEQSLGCTDGDLWGGEIAADQMLEFRPWLDCAAPRTPIDGLYLAGPSTNAGLLATCASGVFAARALLADLETGRLK